MKQLLLAVLLFTSFIAISCSHSVKYTEYRKPSPQKKTEGKITVFEIGDPISAEFTILGKVRLGETGFSHSCGYTDALYLARQKAREIGADAVQIIKVEKPDFWSTCYRVEANLLQFK